MARLIDKLETRSSSELFQDLGMPRPFSSVWTDATAALHEYKHELWGINLLFRANPAKETEIRSVRDIGENGEARLYSMRWWPIPSESRHDDNCGIGFLAGRQSGVRVFSGVEAAQQADQIVFQDNVRELWQLLGNEFSDLSVLHEWADKKLGERISIEERFYGPGRRVIEDARGFRVEFRQIYPPSDGEGRSVVEITSGDFSWELNLDRPAATLRYEGQEIERPISALDLQILESAAAEIFGWAKSVV